MPRLRHQSKSNLNVNLTLQSKVLFLILSANNEELKPTHRQTIKLYKSNIKLLTKP